MQLRFAQQMKKGALDMLVLKLLQHEEKYGYQLISELRDRSNGALALKEGTNLVLCDNCGRIIYSEE